MTQQSGHIYVARTPEQYSYDADGNLTGDGRWTYSWDGENRLAAMEANAAAVAAGALKEKVEFAYDWRGRRIQKTVSLWNGAANVYQVSKQTKYVNYGWNVIAELNGSNAPIRTYAWGQDISGSLTGAGGVGGLVAMSDAASGTSYAPAYDGNGNVTALVSMEDGSVAASYEYGPFGEPLRVSGAMAGQNPFRFSTKYTDDETGLVYYGYRYYAPSTGRWINRDPLGDRAFLKQQAQGKTQKERRNLYREALRPAYLFSANAPVSNYDCFGLTSCGSVVLRALDPHDSSDDTNAFNWLFNHLEDAFTAAVAPHVFVILSDGTRLTNGGDTTGEGHWTSTTYPIQLNNGISCSCFTQCMKKNYPNGSNYDTWNNNCQQAMKQTISKCGGSVPSLY
jgi:RHS repeat-associated protein